MFILFTYRSKGVVHGDLTAFNVLLQGCSAQDQLPGDTRGFQAKLSDFGLARKLEGAQQSITVGSYGAMTHMAPEVLADKQVGYAGDVYSLGVIMWQMFTGSRPWAGLSHLQVTIAVGHDGKKLQWPEEMVEVLGPAGKRFAQLGDLCFTRDPDERPTASDMMEHLQQLYNDLQVGAVGGNTMLPLQGVVSVIHSSLVQKKPTVVIEEENEGDSTGDDDSNRQRPTNVNTLPAGVEPSNNTDDGSACADRVSAMITSHAASGAIATAVIRKMKLSLPSIPSTMSSSADESSTTCTTPEPDVVAATTSPASSAQTRRMTLRVPASTS